MRLGDGLVGKNACLTSMRTWVGPQPHIKCCCVQQCESVIPEHVGREGRQDRRTVGKLGRCKRDNAESGPLLTSQ